MPDIKQLIQTERSKDRFAFFLHSTALTGSMAAVMFTVGAPVVVGMALAATLVHATVIKPSLIRAFEDALPQKVDPEKGIYDSTDIQREDEDYMRDNIEWLDDMMYMGTIKAVREFRTKVKRRERITDIFNKLASMSEEAGLDYKPDLHVLADGQKVTYAHIARETDQKERDKLSLRRMYGRVANAFALEHGEKHILLTDKLIDALSDEELEAVVAHEIGHIAGDHFRKRDKMAFLSKATMMMTGINAMLTFVSTVKNAGLVAIGAAVGLGASYAYKKVARLDTKKSTADLAEYRSLQKNLTAFSIMGLGIAFMAPELTISVGMYYAADMWNKLTDLSFSRRNEFQADRIAADITRNPRALGTALDKIGEYNHSLISNAAEETIHRRNRKGPLSRIFRMMGDIFRSHPNTDRRKHQLENIAKRMKPPAPA